MNSRFESGGAGLDRNVLIYTLSILSSILIVILIRRLVLWTRWKKLAGRDGLGLDKNALRSWWTQLSVELRQDPRKIFDSRERLSAELERLVDAEQTALAQLIQGLWVRRHDDLRRPYVGLDNVTQTESILVRDQEGRRLFEGYLRRVGSDAVDVVPFSKISIRESGVGTEHVELVRANREAIFARILKTSSDGRLWTFSVGEAARVAHQRLEFRIRTPLACLLFSKRLSALKAVKKELLNVDQPQHYLLEKARRENPPTYEDLMKRRKLFFSAELCHLIDLSALGARLRMLDLEESPGEGQRIFVYMPFTLNRQSHESLVEAQVAETWREPTEDPESECRIVRLIFHDMEDADIQKMRTLVNLINATPAKNATSLAEELHEEFRHIPLS